MGKRAIVVKTIEITDPNDPVLKNYDSRTQGLISFMFTGMKRSKVTIQHYSDKDFIFG